MLIGYARVSTTDQNLDLQLDALKKIGCDKIHEDYASGAKTDRNGLEAAIDSLRKCDTLVVWKLDRLGRSLRHLIEVINLLNNRGCYFRSLQENIDTGSSGGKLIFHVFGALAEFERDIIRERTKAGMAAAKTRGRIGGRPRIMDVKKIAYARVLMDSEESTVDEICEELGISRATLYRYLKE